MTPASRLQSNPLLRLVRAVDPSDLAILLPPVGLWWLLRLAATGPGAPHRPDLDAADPAFTRTLADAARYIATRWFRWTVRGVEHVPATGPALLVGNHSGGLMVFDAILAWLAIRDAQGPDRAPHGMAHEFVFRIPSLRRYAVRGGVVPSRPDCVRQVLAAGRLAAVYPGSDWDSLRPFSERNRIVFGGRTGFIRTALRQQVPIVPIVTSGAQEQFIVLSRGQRLARLLRLRERVRSNVFPVGLSLPWGLAPSFLPYLPLPTAIDQAFLPPMRWPRLGPEAADDPAAVRACYDEVVSAMQAAMDDLGRGRVAGSALLTRLVGALAPGAARSGRTVGGRRCDPNVPWP